MTTPRTVPGKVVLIFYGFLGCAGAILFFNLFLERIITFLAYMLHVIHERQLRRKGQANCNKGVSRSSEDDALDSWKPSVYWVMLILFIGATVVAICASSMYYPVEEWTYFEAIYFCFVAFATIGFGDYVVSQKEHHPSVHLYRLGNFVFIVLGCCCIYSLFNVTSILIKQMLNWLICKLNCGCSCNGNKQAMSSRNTITPGLHQHDVKPCAVSVQETEESETDYRRNSGEMICMKDFMQANKISLARQQKQLWETSHAQISSYNSRLTDGVGPLAILSKKLGQDEYESNL